MRVIDRIRKAEKEKTTLFSFEILPPLRGNSIQKSYQTIDALREFNPQYINVTTHRSEFEFVPTASGLYKKVTVRKRPGTIAISAALKSRYNINVVPHLLCSGFTREETEYALMDLHYLGIFDVLVLRGDKAKHERNFQPMENGHAHASELQHQINRWNRGKYLDGSEHGLSDKPFFSYGVAGYPEKHEEAPNLKTDLQWLKRKVDLGAEYVVTQMFFDNTKFFAFVEACRKIGINVPIIPGLKPINMLNQVHVLPKVFHVDLPEALSIELLKCQTDAQAIEVGIEWSIYQAKELMEAGVPNLHFYTMMARHSVKQIARQIF